MGMNYHICPKCGGIDLLIAFVPKGYEFRTNDKDQEWYNTHICVFLNGGNETYKAEVHTEHLLKHCRTCQYKWRDNCLDAKQEGLTNVDTDANQNLSPDLHGE